LHTNYLANFFSCFSIFAISVILFIQTPKKSDKDWAIIKIKIKNTKQMLKDLKNCKNGSLKSKNGETETPKRDNLYTGSHAKRTTSQKFADAASRILGSWKYIIFQTCFVVSWVVLNVVGWFQGWDEYPFIFLNLALSIMAAYTAPVILMSQNREADRDRKRNIIDLATDRSSERKIKEVQKTLIRLEKKMDMLIKVKK
jgi:uncharacterized membrane protein